MHLTWSSLAAQVPNTCIMLLVCLCVFGGVLQALILQLVTLCKVGSVRLPAQYSAPEAVVLPLLPVSIVYRHMQFGCVHTWYLKFGRCCRAAISCCLASLHGALSQAVAVAVALLALPWGLNATSCDPGFKHLYVCWCAGSGYTILYHISPCRRTLCWKCHTALSSGLEQQHWQ